ncbi:hypothetical protein [Bacteroides uniformis]|uniref:hypothetical protein n=1 Tax=Bacteroides uniformis TaxID=820 RepID=UPI001FC7CB09|nr:hypothetical protein [Bacteroides uniformis]
MPDIYSFHHEVKIIPPWWNDFYSMEERILVRCPAPKLFRGESLIAPAEQFAYSTGI